MWHDCRSASMSGTYTAGGICNLFAIFLTLIAISKVRESEREGVRERNGERAKERKRAQDQEREKERECARERER